jgi:hypothetical protein
MGKHGRARGIGIGLALSGCVLAPWAAITSATDRPLPKEAIVPSESLPVTSAVRLDFAELGRSPSPASSPNTQNPVVLASPAPTVPGATNSTPLPKLDSLNARIYDESLSKLFPPLPPVGTALPPEPGPDGRPITLDDLQRYADVSSPLIRQAMADVQAAANPAEPRPKQAATVNTNDRELVQLALTRTRTEVYSNVRRCYFAVLAAQEGMRIHEGYTRLADAAYQTQIERTKAGQASPAEPLQFRALAFEARGHLVQARNRYQSAWKQLASAVGRLDLAPAQIGGRLDRPLPVLEFEALYAALVERHSDVAAAKLALERAHSALNGLTEPPLAALNRAAAAHARADFARATEEPIRVRAHLTAQLAEAYERYDNHRRILAYQRDHILPDQERIYRMRTGRSEPSTGIADANDIAQAQQALLSASINHLQTMENAWLAVVDIGRLMQTRDLFGLANETSAALANLNGLPSCQPNFAAMHWTDVLPSGVSPTGGSPTGAARKNDARLISGPSPTPCSSPDCAVQAAGHVPVVPSRLEPRPVSESALVVPLASIEKSSKRREYLPVPVWRADTEPPLVLPVVEGSTAATTHAMPKVVEQWLAPIGAPTAEKPLPPLPEIIEGSQPKNRELHTAVHAEPAIILIGGNAASGPIHPASQAHAPPTNSATEVIYWTLPQPDTRSSNGVPALRLAPANKLGPR